VGSGGYADGCNDCNNDCGGCRQSCLDKLKGLFHRGGDCGCESSCGHSHGGLFHRGGDCGDCGCDSGSHHAWKSGWNCGDSGCNDCGHSCGHKLAGLFHRRGGDCGCNDCNGYDGYNGNGYGAPGGGPIHAEPIPAPRSGDAPKKMPEPPKSAQILQPSVAPASTLIIEQ